jgi:hypothetical protein
MVPNLYARPISHATTVVCACVEAAHKSRFNNYASYKAAERGMAKFLRDVVNKIWYNDLKDANTFYTKVTALNIIALLGVNSGGLQAINMIILRTNMMQYYVQADGIPRLIVMMEDAQIKATRVGMPIANIELVMIALVAVLAAQQFPCKVDDWQGHPTKARTWQAWKVAFHLAHLKRQRHLQFLGGVKCFGRAHAVIPPPPQPSAASAGHSKTWLLWHLTTPQYFTSLWLPTCRAWL